MIKQNSLKIEKKRKREQQVVAEMIALYCHKRHGTGKKEGICLECKKLCEYAQARSKNCPFMEEKTFCVNCKIHCYKSDMRECIRKVMRFSGPRMILYHPGMALWHLFTSKQEKYRLKKIQERGTKNDKNQID